MPYKDKEKENNKICICKYCNKKFNVSFPSLKKYRKFCSLNCAYGNRKSDEGGWTNRGSFKKEHIPHNKGKNKDNYEPLKRVSKTVSETKKRLFKEGKLKSWNDGLTKETDERLKKIAEKLKGKPKPEGHGQNVSKALKGRVPYNQLNLNEKEIIKLYLIKKLSSYIIAKKFNCSNVTILKILRKNNIQIRNQSEIRTGKYCGENNSNWQGGKSFEPYGLEFNKERKEKIRKRDNYVCQECGKTQKELKRKLYIHHIDYNKKDNSQFNLISLCLKCHIKMNYNRKHWERYFKMKMFIKEFFNPDNLLIFNENKKLVGMEKIK